MMWSAAELRRLKSEDEEARKSSGINEEGRTFEEAVERLPDGSTVVIYEDYLKHQQIYDDLKHADSNFIDYDGLLIEQDKSLGKGGLCWDAAFILAEYISSECSTWPDTLLRPKAQETTRVVEVGAGTGLCGLLIAKNVAGVKVSLTDLPELQALLSRNANRFLDHHNGDDQESNRDFSESEPRGKVEVFELDWADDSGLHGKFDVVLGADVVATLYDPVALAQTIHSLCHVETVVYISFKERLSSIHRAFEGEMERLFLEVIVIHNKTEGRVLSRNHNPDVHILTAKGKRPVAATTLHRLG